MIAVYNNAHLTVINPKNDSFDHFVRDDETAKRFIRMADGLPVKFQHRDLTVATSIQTPIPDTWAVMRERARDVGRELAKFDEIPSHDGLIIAIRVIGEMPGMAMGNIYLAGLSNPELLTPNYEDRMWFTWRTKTGSQVILENMAASLDVDIRLEWAGDDVDRQMRLT